MLSILDVIDRIRSRLKDDNYDNLRFSTNEIIDAINTTCTTLILEFKLNKFKRSELLTKQTPFIQCHYLLGVEEALFNTKPLERRVSVPQNGGELCLLIQGDKISVTPFVSGFLSVVYNYYDPLTDAEGFLPLPDLSTNALVYGSLGLLLEIPTDEQNMQKIAVIKNLHKEAKNVLALYLNSLYSSKNYHSRVVRV
ncbi:hypothetical protein [Helicobacter heilmannii]|uniref:Uncharacterized protein n=1 Tax=Helicobacter heilmannii TaxID=35817 RepID=A0A0K2Y835_HELHE|nr:hypothetical protein [Helicobacter heilmannii]BDQ26859.1 hypothetical protein ASB1_05350 [Helicobacter heilmannii]CCM11923.1 hypothetical protein BN341_8660 [Helicobacter heilmannii ASB1.4]CRI35033.1 hypothetical protein HHE01_00310 [Helicobacter heilmannii]